jgi:hypothetical protein
MENDASAVRAVNAFLAKRQQQQQQPPPHKAQPS